MKKEKQILLKECEYKECKNEFETTNSTKRFCCETCQQKAKAERNLINTEDDYVKLETFLFMVQRKITDVLDYLKDHEELYYTKFNDWFVHESLFKVFKPVKTIHQL